MNPRTSRVLYVAGLLTLLLTMAIQAAANQRNGAARPEAAPAPAVYHDLNALKLYRASEWGLAAPAAAPAPRHDLNALTLYRASEWGQPVPDSALGPEIDLNALEQYRASEWGAQTASNAGDGAAVCTAAAADGPTAVYVPEMGTWYARTDSGFTGRDGGLLNLRDC